MNKGHDNLIPITDRSSDEAREMGKKGGIASGKARRKKADLRKTMQLALELVVPDAKMREQLERLGLDPTMESGLIVSVLSQAIQNGDAKALDTIHKIASDGTLKERQERQARIDRTKAETERVKIETERIKAEIARKDGTAGQEDAQSQIVAIADLINNPTAERTLADFMAGADATEDDEEQEGGAEE